MTKITLIISALTLTVLLLWILGTLYAVRGLEEPKYSVVEVRDEYEIRQYEDYLVAQVELTGEQEAVLSQGFGLLAGYIFGGNTKNESISMTAPVSDTQTSSEKIAMTVPVNDISDGSIHIIQFALPSKYTLATLPKPNNSKVELRQIEGYKAVVLRYSGWASESKVNAKKEQLQKMLEAGNFEIISDMNSAQYNPPYTFPLLRRNEIIVKIK